MIDDEDLLYEYDGAKYPLYLKTGNGQQYIAPIAKHFCRGVGLDICSGRWPLAGARPIDIQRGDDAMALPEGKWDYCFSSHGLEHLADPISALEHWMTRIRPGGVLFVYLPHPAMRYWSPTRNRKHLHSWTPEQMVEIFIDIGLVNVLHSERDLAWSFAVVGFIPQ